MARNLTEDMQELYLSPGGATAEGDGDEEGKKKRQTRGGRGVIKVKKKAEIEKRVCLSRAPRGKKKFVTVVAGLKTCGEWLVWR